MLRIYKTKDYEQMSKKAAEIIAAQIILKPDCVLGLATGSTPLDTYKNLQEYNKKGTISFHEVQTVNLDEYVGLKGTDPNSYRYFMNKNLFEHVDIDLENTHVEDGSAHDLEEECRRYEILMRDIGRVDLQLLGIGNNGHIGFCEPSDSFSKATHVQELTESTIEANARLFDSKDQVPTKALTMGIGTIMSAKHILLIASGEKKAQAVYDSFFGPVTPQVPASVLQLHHNVTVVADEDALRKCNIPETMEIVNL